MANPQLVLRYKKIVSSTVKSFYIFVKFIWWNQHVGNQIFKLFEVGKCKQLIPLSWRKINERKGKNLYLVAKCAFAVSTIILKYDYHLFIVSVQSVEWGPWIDRDWFNGWIPCIISCCLSVLENLSFLCNTGFMAAQWGRFSASIVIYKFRQPWVHFTIMVVSLFSVVVDV